MTYTVHYGWLFDHSQQCSSFDEALAVQREHAQRYAGAYVTGPDADGENDGLTEDERGEARANLERERNRR